MSPVVCTLFLARSNNVPRLALRARSTTRTAHTNIMSSFAHQGRRSEARRREERTSDPVGSWLEVVYHIVIGKAASSTNIAPSTKLSSHCALGPHLLAGCDCIHTVILLSLYEFPCYPSDSLFFHESSRATTRSSYTDRMSLPSR